MASQKRAPISDIKGWGTPITTEDPPPAGGQRRLANLLFALLVACLVVPSSHVALLDGIPFDSFTEVILVIALVMIMGCWGAHHLLAKHLLERRRLTMALVATLLTLVPVRFILFSSSDDVGVFRACYRPANEWVTNEDCEASYENFARGSATRFDSVIDFGERAEPLTGVIANTNWNLGFVNDLRFNVYPWEEGNPDLIRFPFSAEWKAELPNIETQQVVRVTYIGEGTIRLGTQTTTLEGSYGGPATLEVSLPAGETAFVLDYTFDSVVSRSDPNLPGPYGKIKVEVRSSGSGGWSLLRPADVGIGIRVIAILNDALFLTTILGLAYLGLKKYRNHLLPSGFAVGSLLIVCSLSAGTLASVLGASLPIWWVAVITAAIIGLLLQRSPETLRLSLPLIATTLALNIATRIFPNTHYVDFKGRGDDWLTYEHFARSILIERSLQGGEDVFYYQPAFRYFLFGAHLLFGDGAWGVAFVLAVLFTGSLTYFVWRVSSLDFGKFQLHQVGLMTVFVLATLLLLHAEPTLLLFQFHATEIPTWGLIVAVAGLLFPPSNSRRLVVASGLLGLIFIIRPNHLFAVLAVFCVLAVANRLSLRNTRALPSILAPFVIVSLLPLIHNLVYGRQFKLLPTGSETVRDLSVGDVLTAPGDSEVMQILGRKIQLFFNQSNIVSAGASFSWPVILFGLLWLSGLCLLVIRQRRSGILWGLLVVPIGYLTTMVLYDVLIYYPRHVVAFNLSLGLFGTSVALMTLEPKLRKSVPNGRGSENPARNHRRSRARR